MSGVIQNTFNGGMIHESLASLTPENASYKWALNAINASRDRKADLVNEESNALAVDFGVEIVGWGHIEERNQTLYFLADDSLWLHHHGTNKKQFVCEAGEFGCSWNFKKCEFLYGEFKSFNACDELHVYWSSDCIYHVVNIDEMLNPTRKAAVKATEDCSYFDVFKAVCGPHLSATPAHFSGSALEAGAYQFAVQLEDRDGNISNVFDISQPAYLTGEDNIAGQPAKGSLRFTMDNLDPKYTKVVLYVIKTVRQVTVVEKMPDVLPYSSKGLTYTYYGQKGEIVDISVVTNRAKGFLRGQDLIQKDGRLFFYNIKNERNLNYQKYANQIQVEWVEWEVSMEQQQKYHFPSLMRGEVYAIGIVWKYLDGTYSPVFHIPGGGGGGGSAQAAVFAKSADGVYPDPGSETGGCIDGNGVPVPCTGDGDPTSQDPVSGGGAGSGASGSASDTYNPLDPTMLDTTDQFRRERNPSEVKDRPNESDFLEEYTRDDVERIDTDRNDMVQSAACHDNLYGCSEAEEATDADIDDLSNIEENNAELMALFGRDHPDPELNVTNNIKEAGIYLIENAVIEREYIVRVRPKLVYEGATGSGPGGSPTNPTGQRSRTSSRFSQRNVGINTIEVPRGSAATERGDNWVDGLGNSQTDEPIRRVASGAMEVYTSTVNYPDDMDCDGNRFYPGGPVRHHRAPWSSDRPHFVSFQNGVVNKYQPENYEYGQTYVRLMGIRLTNVRRPDPEELPKPLCPTSPFKVVYVQRTDQNKTIFAKGWCSGMFQGENHGNIYNFPRHGVNSFETVDRMIAPFADDLSRLGFAGGDGAYTFHSPDTDCDNSYLPVTHVKQEGVLFGSGWRHGLYAEGKKVRENNFQGTRKDNRGARVSNNINHFTPGGGMQAISGITYAPGDTIVTAASGISTPLMNKFRESSVYMQCGGLSGAEPDKSFAGDVLDHFCPTTANAPYVALVRELPDAYGSVEGLRYIDLGINATIAHASGATSIEGVCGDTFIGPYSKKRTSYISNKVGDLFNIPPKPGSPCRERSWCDSPDDKIFQYFGIDHYPTKLPKSGDLWDPKNYAGLHTDNGGGCGEAVSKKCSEVGMATESDWYWPRTLKSLVHCVVESQVNPWLRETGQGSQLEDGKVWYPKLKDLHLDPDVYGSPWEETYLGRFYDAVEQPSRALIAKKTLIRTLMNLIAPAAMLTQFQDQQGIVDVVSTYFITPILAAFWIMATNTLFTDRRINQMLGIGDCRRDEEGGDLDEHIENWEDNFCAYNWDFSQVNEIQHYSAFSLPYNTCDCDSCTKEDTNNLIYHSNKQNLDSEIDAYRHVRLNNYTEIPGHAGKLQRIFSQGNGFYAHCTDGIWALKFATVTIPGDIPHQQAGTGELLAEPQLIIEGPQEGFAGTSHPNAAINTMFGYFFVDDNAEKIYRFNGTLEEISAYGMFHFFKENLGFCSTTSCYDEKTRSHHHYSLGWDPRYNRLLVTKYDGDSNASFTASYTPLGSATQGGGSRGKWLSLHSYIPQGYNWDRNNFYSIIGSAVYKHHIRDSYQTFYGKHHPFIVEFSARENAGRPFDFKQFILDTEAEQFSGGGYLRDLDITFNKMAIWNSTQGTGTRPVEWISDNAGARNSQLDRTTHDPSKMRLHKFRRNWRTHEVHDLVSDACKNQPLTLYDPCKVIDDINEGIFDCNVLNKQDYANRILSDKELNYRLIFDSHSDVRLFVKSMITIHDEKTLDLP